MGGLAQLGESLADRCFGWHALRTDPAHAAETIERWPDVQRRGDEASADAKATAHSDTPAMAARTANGVAALAQLIRYIALVSDDLQLGVFRATIREQAPEAEAAAMTIAEQMRREGRAEGQRTMLRKQLTLKFGHLRAEYEARIEEATDEQLERYVERVLTAATTDNVLEP
jgi:hypothetical protein